MAAPGSHATQASVSSELWSELSNVPLKSVADTLTTWKLTRPCRRIHKGAFWLHTEWVYVCGSNGDSLPESPMPCWPRREHFEVLYIGMYVCFFSSEVNTLHYITTWSKQGFSLLKVDMNHSSWTLGALPTTNYQLSICFYIILDCVGNNPVL